MKTTFDTEYTRLYARNIPDAEIEILTWAVAVTEVVKDPDPVTAGGPRRTARAAQIRDVYDAATDRYVSVSFYWRPDLRPGDRIAGPAIIAEEETSTLVATAFDATILGNGYIDIRRRPAH